MNNSALITGGAKRIGKQITLTLAEAGYDIALHYNRSQAEAEETAGQVRKLGRSCELFKCDLMKDDELNSLIPKVTETFPELNLLVNNASLFDKATIKKSWVEVFDSQFGANIRAPFFLMKQFALTCQIGQIINLLDARISHPDFHYAAYTLSKKALAELTKMAAVEFAPGIRVNGVAPGIILPPEDESIDYIDRKSKNIPLQRKGDAKDVANAIRFIVENNYITGQIIFVDGGENL